MYGLTAKQQRKNNNNKQKINKVGSKRDLKLYIIITAFV